MKLLSYNKVCAVLESMGVDAETFTRAYTSAPGRGRRAVDEEMLSRAKEAAPEFLAGRLSVAKFREAIGVKTDGAALRILSRIK